ncbi:MAG: COX15/CtaA family protein [Rickettsiales bacterium]|nr:COX15/CtaA family protein [Rickettsiales bacterium]
MKTDNFTSINIWLFTCALLVLVITIIGGYTRLSGSGLSIVEWKPLIGTIPPLNTETWLIEFKKYQLSPEYQLKNYGLSLQEFKKIFLVEYIHRLVGRITGLVFLVPFLYFMFQRQILKTLSLQLGGIFILGLTQAFIGWYMVKSGLTNLPYVSHYRLALHLGMAMIIYSYLLYLATPTIQEPHASPTTLLHLKLLTTLIFIQIIFGAFVSGLKAGLIYNTFPLMNGKIIPEEFSVLSEISLDKPVFVQYLHRVTAFFILIYAILIYMTAKPKIKKLYLFKIIPISIIAQFFLGIATLLLISPWQLALLHQLLAVVILSIVVIATKRYNLK